jgi:hypothetical protein
MRAGCQPGPSKTEAWPDEQDRLGLLALYERHLKETDEYIEAIKARPIVAERVDTRPLDRPWQELRPHSAPTRLTTRSNRGRG